MKSPFFLLSFLLFSLLATEVKFEDIEAIHEQLVNACKNGDLETVTLLVETQKLDASEALVIAAEAGNLNLVSILIRSPLRPRKLHKALIRACRNGYTDVVRRLTADQRCNPAHDNNAAVFVACCHGHLEAAEVLLRKDKVVRAINDSSLMILACQLGILEMVRLVGPFIKFHQVAQVPKDLPDPNTHRRTSPRQSLRISTDTPRNLLTKLCNCSAQKENLLIIAYLFSPESPFTGYCTFADHLAVIDRLLTTLATQSKPTGFTTNLICLLVSLIFDEPCSLEEKLDCCSKHNLVKVKAVLEAFKVLRATALIGFADEDLALPTELRQLIAHYALLN